MTSSDDVLRHSIDRNGLGTVQIVLNAEEQAFAEQQGWTDENVESIIHIWTAWDDPQTGKPVKLIDFMRRMVTVTHHRADVDAVLDNDVVQLVMSGTLLKHLTSYLNERRLVVQKYPSGPDELPTFGVGF